MKNRRQWGARETMALVAAAIILAACTTAGTPAATPQALIPIEPGTTNPAPATMPMATPTTMPALELRTGEAYFNLDGRASFITMRNITGKTAEDFSTLLEWAHEAGTKLIRVHLTHGWWDESWIYRDWSVNEDWARGWESVFDQAQADGIYVMPVFGVWADWNTGTPDLGGADWRFNPLNVVKKGPLNSPTSMFEPGSEAQTKWLGWMETLVKRWQGRDNVAAWEIFSELNIATGADGLTDPQGGVSEAAGEEFAKRAIEVIKTADPRGRPITVSLAGVYGVNDEWASFYKLGALRFIEIHPYNDQLDRELIKEVRDHQNRYGKPVMIGECGLWSKTYAPNAKVGIQHALWAGLVSGAMNGRGLWYNDGYAIYDFNERGPAMQVLATYADSDRPLVKFSEGTDFSGYRPLDVRMTTGIWGGAAGNERSAAGWFRDASSEPPYWSTQLKIAGQSVTIKVPGEAPSWTVDFYDTKSGEKLPGSLIATRGEGGVLIALPEFSDDIAFKMQAVNE